MKNKKICIFIVITVIIAILFWVGIEYGKNISNKMDNQIKKDVNIEERIYQSPNLFTEEYAQIKGIFNKSIRGKDYFHITNSLYLNDIGIELEGYSEFIVNITPDSKILDYNTLENINFKDIKQNDVILYNGIVKNAKGVASAIEVGANAIYVLRSSDIKEIATKKYKGKKELENVWISYVDENHILAQIKLNTDKDDSIIYLAFLNLADNIKVDKYCRNKCVDIVMDVPINDFTEGENKIIKIEFK